MKAFLIAGERSGCGKTSITTAIAAELTKKYKVQTFKVGMDYIDPSYLSAVTKRPCRNLDSFVLSNEEILEIFNYANSDADIALVEGVRGLYEGSSSVDDTGSTASIAKILDLPVILVINAASITRSAAAIIQGFRALDLDIRIVGVILNNVKGKQHEEKVKKAVEHYCNLPIIGCVPKLKKDLKMRHLGLVPFAEGNTGGEFIDNIKEISQEIVDNISLPMLLSLGIDLSPGYSGKIFCERQSDITIGIAKDRVFNFYYADLFPILKSLGANVIFFSPLENKLPSADGYIFGGGYPEYFGKELEACAEIRKSIKDASLSGVPIYAECGGLMYLCRELSFVSSWNGLNEGDSFEMCNVFPAVSRIPAKRVITYVEGRSIDGPFGDNPFKGHAFHYSEIITNDVKFNFKLTRGTGIFGAMDGMVVNNTIGSYSHIHPVSARKMLESFCNLCRSRKIKN